MPEPTEPQAESVDVSFEELFDVDDIQRLQDEFAKATGVGSIITRPDGTPITAPSSFTRFCHDIIRKTEKGCANCYRSDAAIGQLSPDGPTVQPCMSGGLWDAGAGISVAGKHIANWLIGQVRDVSQSEDRIRIYARDIGSDEEETISAFRDVPAMSQEKFGQISQMLFTLANQLSEMAYQNLRQRRLITKLKAAETGLQLAASVFTYAREGIMITDARGVIVDVNQTFSQITGFSRGEALGETPGILSSGLQDARFYAVMWQSLEESGSWSGEIWNRNREGKIYAEWLTISAVRDCEGETQNYVALFTDITQMKRHERQLQHLAHFDTLTGLPNRVSLAERLQKAINESLRSGKQLAVVYLDMDGFKAINDQYGHDVGDELLIAVAQRMKGAIREADTLARIGGDEFVAVLVNLDNPQHCQPVLDRILQAAASQVTVKDMVLQISASIGVTICPQDAGDAEQLLRHADQAMYQAKQAGKNRYHLFDVDLAVALKARLKTIDRIRLALGRQEFVLHYQPKVNMKTGDLIGAEALIRWQHPERGMLMPADFLPFIDDHVVGVEIGEWVIGTALSQIAEWESLGYRIPVSVNVGARQLQQDDFVEVLFNLLAARPEVAPHLLELEITESGAVEDMAQVFDVMQACHKAGVRFALDDFGTGYSSLLYLRRLPFDVLKIDQSFVRNMLDNANDHAIVKGVIGLAKAFQRRVIAEGVETTEIGLLLLSLGCEQAQGCGIASAMSPELLPGWAETWKREWRQQWEITF